MLENYGIKLNLTKHLIHTYQKYFAIILISNVFKTCSGLFWFF